MTTKLFQYVRELIKTKYPYLYTQLLIFAGYEVIQVSTCHAALKKLVKTGRDGTRYYAMQQVCFKNVLEYRR